MDFDLDGRGSAFTITHPPIFLNPNKKYEAALLSLEMYNSIPNITKDKNNIFKYSTDNGTNWKRIKLDTGAYEIDRLNDEIQRHMVIAGDYDILNHKFYISIRPNISKLTSIVLIDNPNYKVDFSVDKTIGPTLGFKKVIISSGYNESPNIVDIMTINKIRVNVDIIQGRYVNGLASPVIYSFFPNASPGRKIVERPNPQLMFYPVSMNDISRIRVWLTDQDNNPIDNRGERLSVSITVREVIENKT